MELTDIIGEHDKDNIDHNHKFMNPDPFMYLNSHCMKFVFAF